MKPLSKLQPLTGFGLGLMAIAQSDGYIKRILITYSPSFQAVPEKTAPWLVAIGILIVLSSSAARFFPKEAILGLTPEYKCNYARHDDLPLIYKMAYNYFGGEVSSLTTMRAWQDRNPEVFSILYRVRRKRYAETREVVGYFCAIPLTRRGLSKILAGEYSRNLLRQDIQSPRKPCAAIYIGAIVGVSQKAKGNILLMASREVESSLKSRTRTILTRPITEDGLRIALKNGFAPMNQGNRHELGTVHMLVIQ